VRIKLLSVALFSLIFFPLVVTAQDVTYNYAHDVNFSQFKTYKWVNVGESSTDQFVDRDIKQAIETQLATKGLIQSKDDPPSKDDAQLLINYQLILTHEKQTTWWSSGGDWVGPGWAYGPGWGWPYGYGFAYGGPSFGTATTSTIPVRNLALDMYDAASNKLIWRGEMSRMPDPTKDPEKNRKKLDKAMAKLLKYYPPKTKE